MSQQNDLSDSSEEDQILLPKQKKISKQNKQQKSTSNQKQNSSKDILLKEWEIGSNKIVKFQEFKGKIYFDIREYYYTKDGEKKPTKKGIFLNLQDFQEFAKIFEEIKANAKILKSSRKQLINIISKK